MKLASKIALFSALALGLTVSVETTQAQTPGTGKTIQFSHSDALTAANVTDYIMAAAMEKMGYAVKFTVINFNAFMQAATVGEMDVVASVNWPQREPPYRKFEKTLAVLGNGIIINGGINGYIIDKATADKYKITNMEQLKDPKIAALFDTDGDGKADLANCDPGWSCGDVVDFQLKAFGLQDTVRSVRGRYELLLGQSIARVKRGEPAIFYTWSPSWVVGTVVPGKDVVWLPSPFSVLPEGVQQVNDPMVKGVIGCAGGQDPCRMTIGGWNYRVVANRDFLAKNAAVSKLLETARWPIEDWTHWETEISKGAKDEKAWKGLAEAWISSHQKAFDDWLKAALAAAT